MPLLILASASPQRKTLLEGLGWEFRVEPSTVDEESHVIADHRERSLLLAQHKARDVHGRNRSAFVIGCDTLVVSHDGALHEKPKDAAEARAMIARQAEGPCVVHSGVCVVAPDGKEYSDVSSSTVYFAPLTPAQIEWWIGTGLWEGRSGAFQIDGPGQLMIERIEGDWTAVVGLPVFLLGLLLEEAGYPVMSR